LNLARAFLALTAGDVDAAEQAITALEAEPAGADDSFRPSVGAAASFIANIPAAAAIARAWLAYLRGDADDIAGFATQARARLRDGEWLLESICGLNLALADWLGGRLRDAGQPFTAAIAGWPARRPRGVAGRRAACPGSPGLPLPRPDRARPGEPGRRPRGLPGAAADHRAARRREVPDGRDRARGHRRGVLPARRPGRRPPRA